MNERNPFIKFAKCLDSDYLSVFGDEIIQDTGFVRLACGYREE